MLRTFFPELVISNEPFKFRTSLGTSSFLSRNLTLTKVKSHREMKKNVSIF